MPTLLTLHPRHRLDLRWCDVVLGLAGLGARDRERPAARVLDRVGVPDDGLVAASVRSGWQLLLDAAGWPGGAEVLVAAVTHPDMAVLVARAGLTAVPVEVDLATLLPAVAALEAARTPRTRAVLVAQLFGARADLDALAAWCRSRGLVLVEDAAQAYAGPGSLGSTADVTLVSFGLLKTATAVGGAVLRVADPGLRTRMRVVADGWPVQRRRAYGLRLLRAALLLLLARVPVYGALLVACRVSGRDPDAVLDALSRSRHAPSGLVDRCRVRPCAPLLHLLARRVGPRDPSVARVGARAAAGERLRDGLPAGSAPGERVGTRTHWLFPVRADDPARLVGRLHAAGVDASAGTSNLVSLTTDGPAADLMRHVVYVPAYPELPEPVRAAVRRVLLEG